MRKNCDEGGALCKQACWARRILISRRLALIGLTAVISVEDTLHLKADEKILIQGGAGGVASFAIQLAKHIGAYVITTTSAGNVDYVKGLGADEVIDYNAQDFRDGRFRL